MQFSIEKNSFARIIELASSIAQRKATMPILENVKIEASSNRVSIYATDLEISFKGTANALVEVDGQITIKAKTLNDIVRELPEGDVVVTLLEGERVQITSNKTNFKINGTSSDEFPEVVGIALDNPISTDAAKLYGMFSKTEFCVSQDETRYNINGVCIASIDEPVGDDNSGLRFVSTDGHRLALIDRPANGLFLESKIIVPRKGIVELRKLLEKEEGAVSVSIDNNFMTVQAEDVTLGIRLVDGSFPDYNQILPKTEPQTTLEINRDDFLRALNRVMIAATDKQRSMKFSVSQNENGENKLVLLSHSPEVGEAIAEVDVVKIGEDVSLGFNSTYVKEAVNNLKDSGQIYIKLYGAMSPAVFKGSEDELYTCIVMPMRFE